MSQLSSKGLSFSSILIENFIRFKINASSLIAKSSSQRCNLKDDKSKNTIIVHIYHTLFNQTKIFLFQ